MSYVWSKLNLLEQIWIKMQPKIALHYIRQIEQQIKRIKNHVDEEHLCVRVWDEMRGKRWFSNR